ncbi:tryptophan halogenase family protein [Undibacterium sp. JH2W]|uniref:tryptophan halogenase family protein n=1 Tax=Undibacterium sp. JH2W TaxID=3413037 RepID=UPI003BF11A4B
MKAVKSILIVGGGTAGWLSACFLAKHLSSTRAGTGIEIRLVESKDIGIIGVGEGSFPSIRGTLAAIGIDEARFVKACNATFKQGIRFDHWVRPAGSAGADHYFHPFSHPSQRGPELLPYWLQGLAECEGRQPGFADAVTMQKCIADASRAPKRFVDKDFLGPMNYAYHFDAGRLAALLAEHGQSLGVKQVLATVEHVQLDGQGAIAAVHTRDGQALAADLFIDCTGFSASLIGKVLGSPFKSLNDVLFVDRAVALQVPYARPDAAIPSYTISSAQEAGWIWDIGLQQRRGIGYVYSSRHTDDAGAEQVLRKYIGPAADEMTPRLLKLNVGYRETQWIKNCVAIGLSGGFIEPLESSGIGLIETATYLLTYLFPFNGEFEAVARQFNQHMKARYERIVDFVKMHFCLSQRTDSAFWRDNRELASIPESLQEKLKMWSCRPPHRMDFIADLEMYPPSSWQFVLYGMEFQTDMANNHFNYPQAQDARQEFQMIAQMAQRALADLPDHRLLVEHLCKTAR